MPRTPRECYIVPQLSACSIRFIPRIFKRIYVSYGAPGA
jgi:hypothetical protein